MKTKLFIILWAFLAIFIVNCGGDTAPESFPCESDRDCSEDFFCISGTCIFQPECETDEDCTGENEICNSDYQCTNFWDDSACLGELCYGDCESCDQYTSCYQGECINACDAHEIAFRTYLLEACLPYQACIYCECRLQGLQNYQGKCTELADINCETASESHILQKKDRLLDFSHDKEVINAAVQHSCAVN